MSTRSRAGLVSAAAFVALYAGFTVVPVLPEGSYSDERVLALYTEPGSRTAIAAGGYLLALAGVALLPFLAALHRRLRTATASMTPTVAVGAGLLYVACLLGAGNLFGGYATGIAIGELQAPADATLVRVLSNQGFGLLLIGGLLAAAALVLSTSIAGMRSGVLPRWLVIAGFVVAPLLLLGAAWVPQFLVPLWVLAVGVALARPAGQRAPSGAAPSHPVAA